MSVMSVSVNYVEKLEKFTGLHFKRRQQKMLFYLTTLNLARFLTEKAPELKEEEQDAQLIISVEAWKKSDYLCRNYIMNSLSNTLYNVYTSKKLQKNCGMLWTTNTNLRMLEAKIEEDNRCGDKKGVTLAMAKSNVVEHGQSLKNKKQNNPGKMSMLGPKDGVSKKQNFQGKCYNCYKIGHMASECRLPKKNKNQANIVDNIIQDVSNMSLVVVVLKVNLVGSNLRQWWIDTGATRHICSNKGMFVTFKPLENGDKLSMGNSTTFEPLFKAKVRFTSDQAWIPLSD
ncbi:uncharacterized protein LOC120279452 [Dioscorea cayenensis subsp. rotundata]|uniref:Uncharacterized protein LOC120279452 n=1 Tax=Dioscorea cayennensis subsp. rotundata TaxID=55577 RepID=A0AB40CU17_DIOCR|nr:uncharacterized protein LOC120279452 [Dioscorea cayenensis subsp. rotundata]